jgi:NADH-quinone oxidoreductase subunit M
MINHGISTGALFALVGMIYERFHTREISHFGGLARKMPWLAFFMLFFTFSSIGLPGMNGFAGEFLLLVGMFQRAFQTPFDASAESVASMIKQFRIISVLAVLGVVLGAWYMLWLVQRVFFGPLKVPSADHDDRPVQDMSWREIAAVAPLMVFVIWIGIQPQCFLGPMANDLKNQSQIAQERLEQRLAETEHDQAVAAQGQPAAKEK